MAISGVSATTKTTVDPVTGVEEVDEVAPASDSAADAEALLPAVDQAVQSTPLPDDTEPTSGDPTSTISPKHPTPPTPPVPGAPAEPGPPAGYYVKASDYGVVGDGVTDNTDQLNHAARDARAVGQSVYLGAGTYAHSGTIDLDSTKLNGDGNATVLKSTNPDQAAVVLTGKDAALTNVKVDGDASANTKSTPESAGVLVKDASKATVDHVSVQDAAGDGIRLDNAKDATVTSNHVQDPKGEGITQKDGSKDNKIQDNVAPQGPDENLEASKTKDGAAKPEGDKAAGDKATDDKAADDKAADKKAADDKAGDDKSADSK